jgi:heat shock protein HtpX
LPGSALADSDNSGAIREASGQSSGGSASNRELARQVDDLFYKDAKYRMISCPCGTTLKIPPDFQEPGVKCPHCGTKHAL